MSDSNAAVARLADDVMSLEFDDQLRTRVALGDLGTDFDASEILTTDAGTIHDFDYRAHTVTAIDDPVHGDGTQLIIEGEADGVRKSVAVQLYRQLPGMITMSVTYTNTGDVGLPVTGWRNGAHELTDRGEGFFTFSGASHSDRRDWVQRVTDGFDQQNTLGMDSSDYGGGTPLATLWRRDLGLSVGHVAEQVRILRMPVRRTGSVASIAIEGDATALAPGSTMTTPTTFVIAHAGDHFGPAQRYRDYMADLGMAAPRVPASAFEPIWCAWGYDRDFTVDQVLGTLPKVRELGFRWVVLDDGWQTNLGDWELHPQKFPQGDADMRALTDKITNAGLRPRLWWAPLAVHPESALYARHPDMLLLDHDGRSQEVTWWNVCTLCPAYQPTIDYFVAQVRRFIGDWGYQGLKIDGQHLNGVAPCYNPAHDHQRPEESTEGLARFWKTIYDTAHQVDPDAVIELCPCGTAFDFHNLPYIDQYPSSDPESSYQVRHKGKTMKALMGTGGSYAGDHVELTDTGEDFASSYGVGAVLSTKFTYPAAALPSSEFVLTPEREQLWRRWVVLSNRTGLTTGEYRGELYDIGFDTPEAHVVAKGAALHYAFFADRWDGPVQLRGLGPGRYRLTDPWTGTDLGTADDPDRIVELVFEEFQLIIAEPI